ncbi:hypothetical protein A9404_12815 [Halothiobacillus diazotrophicus]|uniref:Large ribosomal RNA subunit accumulation protein YceD n=1 Tax=Halothiobacillus diazotrophicus TaxID=1860122 RepID=A0A191ZJT9_9GAMM|nr:YceD family protein [Halothiobacillus diazotrophicus]ANJ68135.1 hypothetical protein A9404_12815 [Halothiobacillus diazotrophicus]
MNSKTVPGGIDASVRVQPVSSLPEIGVRAACDGERVFDGAVLARDLPRLASMVPQAAPETPLRFSVRFHRDVVRNLLADITVRTEVEQACARCLQPMTIPVTGQSLLQFVYSDEQAQHVMDECEPVLMDDEGAVSLVDLLEDEALMAVPSVVMHEHRCQPAWREADDLPGEPAEASDEPTEPERPNPFAELAKAWRRSDKS